MSLTFFLISLLRVASIVYTIGARAFPVAAARTWKSLPSEVTCHQSASNHFRLNLKLIRFRFFP